MKDQHTKINGYRDLSQSEIDSMNSIKSEGERLKLIMEELESDDIYDQRMVALAKDHLQIGIMLAVRSVAKPESF